jgi:hypothetical protein
MSEQPFSPLPNASSWRFDEIAHSEPDRERKLESAGSPGALLAALGDALDKAINGNDVRVGREHAEGQWEDCRAVVQFSIGADVFDWFFNGRTGYRAHFRAHHMHGIVFNSQIIDAFRARLAKLPDVISGRELDIEFEDHGPARLPRTFLLESLVTYLSKVWFCAKRIRPCGGMELLPIGLGGVPKLILDGDVRWGAPSPDDDSAWLNVKGAFLGKNGPYQLKDPVCRAKHIQATGEQ